MGAVDGDNGNRFHERRFSMPVVADIIQGQSLITEDKERGFASFFGQQLKCFKALWDGRYTYFHFDCHAGSGFNAEVDVVGSPVLFANLASERLGPGWVMVASEIVGSRAKELGTHLKDTPNAYVMAGDNEEMLACVPDIIASHGERPAYAQGSILLDPNNQDGIPVGTLHKVCALCQRLDVVFNFPGNAMKRISLPGGDGSRLDNCNGKCIHIEDLPYIMNKRHLLIRTPLGAHQFTLVVGRNIAWGQHRTLGIYDWHSATGQQIRRKVSMSEKQLEQYCSRNQKTLWPDTKSTTNI